jgi:hypothetical protein
MRYEKKFNDTDVIFHYTKLEIALECILKNKQLHFNKFINSADPHESNKRNFALQSSIINNCNEFWEKRNSYEKEINVIIQQKLRMTCFCRNLKNYLGYCRSRMWSQYADNHRGVCLAFSKKALQKAVRKQFKSEFKKNRIVRYYPLKDIKFNKMHMNQAKTIHYTDLNHDTIKEHLNNNYKYLFFKKHWDYRDEAEYRFIVLDMDNKFEYIDISDCLVGIILGHNFPITYLPIVESIESELKIIWDQVRIWDDSNMTLSQ